MVLVFLTTSLTLKYLGDSQYGIWVTIYSIVSWAYMLDFGFSNVIKTKLPILINTSKDKVNTFLSTIYIGVAAIAFLILIIAVLLNMFVSFSDFLNIKVSTFNFNSVLFLNMLFSLLILIIGNYKALFAGIIQTHVVEFSMMLIQLIIFCVILSLCNFNISTNESKIIIISSVFGLVNIIVGLVFTIYFLQKHKNIKISLKYFNLNILKTNTSMGFKYFIMQICMIIMYSTDYVLITKYFGAKSVANYDIVLKLFQAPMLLLIAGMSPFWTIFSKTFAEKKYVWIKKSLKIYNYLFLIFIAGIIFLVMIINKIIFLWIRKEINPSQFLLICIATYVSMRTYTAFYNYFLNGINKINISLYLTIFGAVINIPVCIFLINMGIGIPGIVIGTCISILPTTVILPIQSFYVINKKIKTNDI